MHRQWPPAVPVPVLNVLTATDEEGNACLPDDFQMEQRREFGSVSVISDPVQLPCLLSYVQGPVCRKFERYLLTPLDFAI
jgi:hypothetical protein